LKTKQDLLAALGKPVSEKDNEKLAEYDTQQKEIKTEAEKLAKESRVLLHRHETFSHSVTFFQISIAVSAMSVLVRSRRLWAISLAFATVGAGFMVFGLMGH
jgi:hypothetical protein